MSDQEHKATVWQHRVTRRCSGRRRRGRNTLGRRPASQCPTTRQAALSALNKGKHTLCSQVQAQYHFAKKIDTAAARIAHSHTTNQRLLQQKEQLTGQTD